MTTSASNPSQKIKDYELFLMGHPIFSADQPGEAIYVVVEGEVTIYRGDRPAKTLRSGEFLNEIHLRATEGPGFCAIAKTNCRLVVIDQKIMAVLEQYPLDFRVEAMRVMVERLTWRVSPPIQLAIRPQPQPGIRSAIIKTRSISDTFSLVTTG
ncbi:MAG: cyclic nucleotide-binding domain-containing protein [Chloroflexi bacterium]|nr:cyclic nucleotide-binding domain-containing protein [Chloroflexota bacterium]